MVPSTGTMAAQQGCPDQDANYKSCAGKVLLKPGPALTLRQAKRWITDKQIPMDVVFSRMVADGMGKEIQQAQYVDNIAIIQLKC